MTEAQRVTPRSTQRVDQADASFFAVIANLSARFEQAFPCRRLQILLDSRNTDCWGSNAQCICRSREAIARRTMVSSSARAPWVQVLSSPCAYPLTRERNSLEDSGTSN
jgi:hypothetical protein